MTTATGTVLPRHSHPRSRSWRSTVWNWLEEDHEIRHAILVPTGLASLAGLFLVGYALLFLS